MKTKLTTQAMACQNNLLVIGLQKKKPKSVRITTPIFGLHPIQLGTVKRKSYISNAFDFLVTTIIRSIHHHFKYSYLTLAHTDARAYTHTRK